MFVEEAMSHRPHSVTAQTTVREALRVLFDNDIRHLPVVDGTLLIGIVSIRDLPMVVATGIRYSGDPHEVERLLDQPVANVMTKQVISISPGSGLGSAVDLMLANKFGALPVVSAENTLIGILSYTDVLRVAGPLL